MDEEPLLGGNTHDAVVRVGDTVRRPAGEWTPGVHALLRHLEAVGFEGAPRPLGLDEQGREIVTYIAGRVVHPDHEDLIATDQALASVAGLIRRYHDAAESFPDIGAYRWAQRGGDPRGPHELLCHNDLASWNLIALDGGGWAFIDWDGAAPGRRAWDLGWAVTGLVPLFPDRGISERDVLRRLAVFADGYGRDRIPNDVLAVGLERCRHEADLIERRGAAGEAPYARLLAEGHAQSWNAAAEHIAGLLPRWQDAGGAG